MATKHEVSRGLKKALMERTSGTGTMEEMMAEETAVIASTSNAIFAYYQWDAADKLSDLRDYHGADRVFHETESGASGSRRRHLLRTSPTWNCTSERANGRSKCCIHCQSWVKIK